MNITTVVDAQVEPVSLAEVYLHLRLDVSGSPPAHPDDAMLRAHISSARQEVEGLCRRSLIYKTLRLSAAAWPDSTDPATELRLWFPPVIAITSVSYYDDSNVQQVVADTDYYLTDEFVPQVRFVSSFVPPTLYDRPDAISVRYLAGYPPDGSPPSTQEEYAANVPAPLRQAVLIGVQLLYDQLDPKDREALMLARDFLIQPSRVPTPV